MENGRWKMLNGKWKMGNGEVFHSENKKCKGLNFG
jgi:hypothetical protein